MFDPSIRDGGRFVIGQSVDSAYEERMMLGWEGIRQMM
jgi:hypothetical protein